ncbi:MAG: NAD(P)-dependent oxidoreductase, partial [Deltaproteobacteria bacterium]|nr:NAD(P)-dependent oxidoreductase [Deltaproteobacteria bacterium]
MNTLSGKTIGLIGLGLMGRPMSINLLKAGARLIVTNRSPEPRLEIAKQGATAFETPAEVAGKADIIICIVSDTSAVESTLFADNGVLQSLRAQTLFIDMGTTSMKATKTFAQAVSERGGYYVDAPVSGGTIGAEQGNLTIMAGGSDKAFTMALPILQVLGDRITHVGSTGAGQVAKAANQVIVGLNIGAVAEAL